MYKDYFNRDFEGVRRVDDGTERFNRVIHIIKSICDVAGFSVENRIILKDNRTGRVWK